MKAKRIVSILLTGSMLLSLLPVSALAAAPVFDAPAQTTAKKAAPLVQEADASRSTEEEAATRSSRDLDAENGTADSITIQLNAEGKPADSDDLEHWVHSGVTSYDLKLYQGIFTLQPSSEAGAESALQDTLYIYKDAEFNSGTVGSTTFNNGTISGGTFQKAVHNDATPTIRGSSLTASSKNRCTTGAPSPVASSKGRCTTGAPSPAAPLRKLLRYTPTPSRLGSRAGPLKRV